MQRQWPYIFSSPFSTLPRPGNTPSRPYANCKDGSGTTVSGRQHIALTSPRLLARHEQHVRTASPDGHRRNLQATKYACACQTYPGWPPLRECHKPSSTMSIIHHRTWRLRAFNTPLFLGFRIPCPPDVTINSRTVRSPGRQTCTTRRPPLECVLLIVWSIMAAYLAGGHHR